MCVGRASTDGRCARSTRGVGEVRYEPLRGSSRAEETAAVSMVCSPRSGPERRRTPIADRQADDVLDIGAPRVRDLGPAARPRRSDALRQRAEAEAQQRGGAAVAARACRAAHRSRAEGAARRRHGAGFRCIASGNNSLQQIARAGRSATTVPAGSRDPRRMTPGAPWRGRVARVDKTGNSRRPTSDSQAGVTTAPSSQ